MIQEIEEFLKNATVDNYYDGISLMEKYKENPSLINDYSNRSPRFNWVRLKSDLSKLSCKSYISENITTFHRQQKIRSSANSTKTEPDIILRAKIVLHNLWVFLSRQHQALFDLGEANDNITIRRRKAILDARRPVIQRYESIFEKKEDYFRTGIIPDDLSDLLEDETPAPSVNKKSIFDPTSLSDLNLHKKLHSIKTQISQVENMLKYQNRKKLAKPDPMPDCPKRKKLESDIKRLHDEHLIALHEFEKRINKLNNDTSNQFQNKEN